MTRKIAAIITALAMVLSLLPLTALPSWAAEIDNVTYRDDTGTEVTRTAPTTVVDDQSTTWGSVNRESWYIVQDTVEIDQRVTVTGDVHLILADGASLTVNGGIAVEESDSFTVYAQSEGRDTGALIAKGSGSGAGIGSIIAKSGKSGNITINGGIITATGGRENAAIGGKNVSKITINSGEVTATGGDNGAGIGSGETGSGGEIIINGGTVHATGGTATQWTTTASGGAGIGNGWNSFGGTVTINGGTITAIGGDGGDGVQTESNNRQNARHGGNGIENATIGADAVVTAIGGDGGNGAKGWPGGDGGNGGDGLSNCTVWGGLVSCARGTGGTYGQGTLQSSNGNYGSNGYSLDDCTVTGGSIKHDDAPRNLKNNDGEALTRGTLEVSDVTSVSVDGEPWYIPANHEGDNTLYLYLTQKDHRVQVRTADGQVTTYTAKYENSRFAFTKGDATAPSQSTALSVALSKDEVVYSSTEPVTVTATITAATTRAARSAALMDSVRVTVTDENGGQKPVQYYGTVQNNQAMVNLDVSALPVGTYTITAEYGGSGTAKISSDSATLTVVPYDLQDGAAMIISGSYTYNGKPQTPQVAVTLNGKTLFSDRDYTLSYNNSNGGKDNITDAGTVTATAMGTGNYTGTVNQTFEIQRGSTTFSNVMTKNGEETTTEFTYGDTITVSGSVNSQANASTNSLSAPAEKQVALFLGATQLTDPVNVSDNGNFTVTYDTAKKGINIGPQNLTLKYGGEDNWKEGTYSVQITLEQKLVTAEFVGTITKVYDGNTYALDGGWSLKLADKDKVNSNDEINIVGDARYDSENVNNVIPITFKTIEVSGKDKYFYDVKAPENITGSITKSDSALDVTVKNSDKTTFDFTYGETIIVEVTSQIAATNSLRAVEKDKVALRYSDEVLATATKNVEGKYILIYNTAEKKLPLGEALTLTVEFGGDNNLNAQTKDVTVKLSAKPIKATVSGDVSKVYDGNTDVTVNLTAETGVGGDANLAGTVSGKFADVNAGKDKEITLDADSVQWEGTNSQWYSITLPNDVQGTINKATPTPETPSNLTATYGDKLGSVKLLDGWAWKDSAETSVGEAGAHEFAATYTPADTKNYKTVEKTLTVTVQSKALSGEVTIDGKAIYGEKLTAQYGGSEDVKFQWQRNGANIDGATATTYTLALEDIDQEISVVVTPTDSKNFTGEKRKSIGKIAKISQTAPAKGDGYRIDFKNETIAASETYELATKNTATTGEKSLTVTPGANVFVRLAESGTHYASDWTEVDIPARPSAPKNVVGSINTLSGLTTDMEYSRDGKTWAAVKGTSMDLTAGDYYVRYKATDKNFASESVKVTVKPYSGKYSYETTVTQPEHGKISVDKYVTEGENVTITVTPDDGYAVDSVSVKAKNGKSVDVTKNSDGTYSFTMPKSNVSITATLVESDEPTPEPQPEPSALPFTDVSEGAWYIDPVRFVYSEGLMTGTSATTFSPNLTTTRGMIVAILYRMEGEPDLSNENLGYPFADVDASAYYGDAVYWARLNGIVSGYTSERFGPTDSITREQLAAILYNYAEYKGVDTSARNDLSSYSDSGSISGWATDAMQWANAEGIVNGMTATELAPKGNATRAQVAAMLERYVKNVLA